MNNRKVQVIQVPFDSGNRSVRMGRGPEHFISNGLKQVLEAEGHTVFVESVESKFEFQAEIRTQFELYGLLAEGVFKAHQEEKFPLILSGNCGAVLGAIGGARTERFGVIWFDAHGDFNTPETTSSGFLDGMGLAIAAGICWKGLAASIPHFTPISGANILHIGGRDFDKKEGERFEQVGCTVVDAATIQKAKVQEALKTPISKLRLSLDAAHLHIDLDVLNPKQAPANEYATEEGGLSIEEVVEAIGLIKENLRISSATIAAYDPRYDTEGKTLRAGLKLIKAIVSEKNR